MGQPVVHFEIIGSDAAGLRSYYGQLFGWEFQVRDATTETVSPPGPDRCRCVGPSDHRDATTETVSPPGRYGFVHSATNGGGVDGGVGGGDGYAPRALFYVGVPSVEVALREAERLGGKRRFGPEGTPGSLVVGQFTDPEGNVIGVAGTE